MKARRVFLEMGAGTDLHGGDYTKAALRALDDALHHSSIGFTEALGLRPEALHVEVKIGVQHPEQVDREAVRAALAPRDARVTVVEGGMDIPSPDEAAPTVVASAAVIVRLEMT